MLHPSWHSGRTLWLVMPVRDCCTEERTKIFRHMKNKRVICPDTHRILHRQHNNLPSPTGRGFRLRKWGWGNYCGEARVSSFDCAQDDPNLWSCVSPRRP
jgi:hypothetical protein